MPCCPLFPPAQCSHLCSAVFTQLLLLQLGFWAPLWLSWCGGFAPVLRAAPDLRAGLCSLEQQCLGHSRLAQDTATAALPGQQGSLLEPAVLWCSSCSHTLQNQTGKIANFQFLAPSLSCQNHNPSNDVGGIEQTVLEDSAPFFCIQDRVWQKEGHVSRPTRDKGSVWDTPFHKG